MTEWTVKVDFTSVESNQFREFLDGEHLVVVREVTQEMGQEYPYLKFALQGLSGAGKGATINHICTLKPEGLFNLRNTLTALGFNIPKAAVNISPTQIKGRQMRVTVGDSTRRFRQDGTPYKEIKRVDPAPTKSSGAVSATAAVTDTWMVTDGDL